MDYNRPLPPQRPASRTSTAAPDDMNGGSTVDTPLSSTIPHANQTVAAMQQQSATRLPIIVPAVAPIQSAADGEAAATGAAIVPTLPRKRNSDYQISVHTNNNNHNAQRLAPVVQSDSFDSGADAFFAMHPVAPHRRSSRLPPIEAAKKRRSRQIRQPPPLPALPRSTSIVPGESSSNALWSGVNEMAFVKPDDCEWPVAATASRSKSVTILGVTDVSECMGWSESDGTNRGPIQRLPVTGPKPTVAPVHPMYARQQGGYDGMSMEKPDDAVVNVVKTRIIDESDCVVFSGDTNKKDAPRAAPAPLLSQLQSPQQRKGSTSPSSNEAASVDVDDRDADMMEDDEGAFSASGSPTVAGGRLNAGLLRLATVLGPHDEQQPSMEQSTEKAAAPSPTNVVGPNPTGLECDEESMKVYDRYVRVIDDMNSVINKGPKGARDRVQRNADAMRVLNASWEEVCSEADTRDQFAIDTFTIVLTKFPHFLTLFRTAVPHAEAKIVFEMIGRGVAAFSNPDDLIDLMTELGARHRYYRVYEEHFVALRDAFFEVFPKYVSRDTLQQSMEVWQLFWRTIIKLMANGGSTVRGDDYEKQRVQDFINRLINAVDVLAVKQRAPPDSDRKNLFIHVMSQYIQSENPELEITYFRNQRNGSISFNNNANDDDDDDSGEDHSKDASAMDRDFDTMVTIIHSLDDIASVAGPMDRVLHQHLAKGFVLDDLPKYKNAFVQTWEHFLRGDRIWTPMLKKSISEAWDIASNYWGKQQAAAEKLMKSTNAPDSKTPFCLIFTDIEASTRLWDKNPETMGAAVRQHHSLIRNIIGDYGGYEVKTVGDSFMIATKDALVALKIALGIQLELMRAPIADGFEMLWTTQGGGNPGCWRKDSLRVRIGIHYCTEATAVFDSIHQRCDYYGPSVNLAARVEGLAYGGQILMTQATLDALKEIPEFTNSPAPKRLLGFRKENKQQSISAMFGLKGSPTVGDAQSVSGSTEYSMAMTTASGEHSARYTTPLSDVVECTDWGSVPLKGIVGLTPVVSILPISLVGRLFEPEEDDVMI